nr:CDP-alcohol phosphatidyltransferase family protein [Sphingomonas sp. dw_22]
MTSTPPDGSRDRRIEDPTNLWVIHPTGRRLLPWFLERGISANAVSIGGLFLGILAAAAYANWQMWPFAFLGLFLSVCWLIADGLDGMIARATNTASPLGRFLDGVCDHGVFILIYVAMATSIGTREGWALAVSAGVIHALQSNFFESERARYHRRCKGIAAPVPAPSSNPLVRFYDSVSGIVDTLSRPFDDMLRRASDPLQLADEYGTQAARPLRLMSLMSANVRVYAIFVACLAGNPRIFWWFELVPMTAILIACLAWHRLVELRLIRSRARPSPELSLNQDSPLIGQDKR